jgi:Helix-turn-helix domain
VTNFGHAHQGADTKSQARWRPPRAGAPWSASRLRADPWTGPSLTIAEAAGLCGVSVSTIRRYLAAERAHTIQALETALRALQAHQAATAPNRDRISLSPAPSSDATHTAGPARQSGVFSMVPKRRPAKRELSQEEKAATIGRALARQRPPQRR